MDKAIGLLKQLQRLFLSVAETGLALVAFVFVIYLLLGGDSGDFVLSVVTNASLLVDAIGAQAIIGVALALAIVGLLRSRS